MKSSIQTPVPGLTFALDSIRQIFENAAPKLPPSPRPRIKLPPRPLNKLKAFEGLDELESVGMYVTRDVNGVATSVEVAVEVLDWRTPVDKEDPGEIELGNCWRLESGYQDWLSLEEEEEAKQLWIEAGQRRAEKSGYVPDDGSERD